MTEESRASEHGNEPDDTAADVKKDKMKEEEEEMNDENEEESLLDAPAGGIDVRRQSSAPQVGNSLFLISSYCILWGARSDLARSSADIKK